MKRLVVYINLPRLLFHICFFLIYKERCYGDVIACKALRKDLGGGKIRLYDLCYLLVFDKAFRALFYFRIGRYKYLIWYWLKPDPSFIIATDMIVGPYVKLVHPFATVINANKIGDHFTVMQNVTIGNKGGNSSNIPTIGNNVCICCHAVVLGNISIGNNVIIGAGSVVTKSIPDDCVVVGNPARIIKQKGNTVNINL